MYQIDPPCSQKQVLPTMYDLKSEDLEEPNLPDEFDDFQPQLLRETFMNSIKNIAISSNFLLGIN